MAPRSLSEIRYTRFGADRIYSDLWQLQTTKSGLLSETDQGCRRADDVFLQLFKLWQALGSIRTYQ